MKAQGTVKGILFEGNDGAEEALKTFPPRTNVADMVPLRSPQ